MFVVMVTVLFSVVGVGVYLYVCRHGYSVVLGGRRGRVPLCLLSWLQCCSPWSAWACTSMFVVMVTVLFSVVGVGVYLGLFFSTYKDNVLTSGDMGQNFTSRDRAYLDYSFYLLAAAAAAYLVNLILLALSGLRCDCSFESESEKVIDNGIILY
jgi:hypothetical protein